MPAEKVGDQPQGRRRATARQPVKNANATGSDAANSAARPRLLRRRPVVEAAPAPEQLPPGYTPGKGRPTPSRRRAEQEEEDEGNLIERTGGGLRDYFEGVQSELSKVAWPSREETRRLTIVVTATLIAASILLGIISGGFTELFRIGLSQPIVLFVFMVVALGGGYLFYRRSSASS